MPSNVSSCCSWAAGPVGRCGQALAAWGGSPAGAGVHGGCPRGPCPSAGGEMTRQVQWRPPRRLHSLPGRKSRRSPAAPLPGPRAPPGHRRAGRSAGPRERETPSAREAGRQSAGQPAERPDAEARGRGRRGAGPAGLPAARWGRGPAAPGVREDGPPRVPGREGRRGGPASRAGHGPGRRPAARTGPRRVEEQPVRCRRRRRRRRMAAAMLARACGPVRGGECCGPGRWGPGGRAP